ncbi:MAG: hypothetical protein WCA46_13410 [Actinocatenispora sp.]
MSEQRERPTEYSEEEWELLLELPEAVVIAATSAEADSMRRTVDEGLAGRHAIDAGRHSDSPLVRRIATELRAANSDGPRPAAVEFNDRAEGLADVLAASREAAAVLKKAAPADATAYRQWLTAIAEQVCGAAKSGGFLGLGGTQVSESEQRFLADLAAGLGVA